MAINKIILNDVEIELSDEQARRIIGSGNLSTVAQTLVGGVNEINAKVGNGILTTDNKVLIGGVNEINEKISTINSNIEGVTNEITTINNQITNIGGTGGLFARVFDHSISSIGSISANTQIEYEFDYNNWYNFGAKGYIFFGCLNLHAGKCLVKRVSHNPTTNIFTFYIVNYTNNDIPNCPLIFTPLFIKEGALVKLP